MHRGCYTCHDNLELHCGDFWHMAWFCDDGLVEEVTEEIVVKKGMTIKWQCETNSYLSGCSKWRFVGFF